MILSKKCIDDLSINQPESQEDSSNSPIVSVGGRIVSDTFFKDRERGRNRDIKAESDDEKSVKKHRRLSGMWKGKVKMPDDFDELSNDILADFGID